MSLTRRILFYLGGFGVGLIILFFFLGGKKASCDYMPNARTLKNIRSKTLIVPIAIHEQLVNSQMDTSAVHMALKNGDVLFSDSITSLDSCNIYTIESKINNHILKLSIENCRHQATVRSLTINP